MKCIGLILDIYSYLEESVFKYFEFCDEIWYVGDIGDVSVVDQLEVFCLLRVVYGNIDDVFLCWCFLEDFCFVIEGVDVFMIYIGGYFGCYNCCVWEIFSILFFDLYICGYFYIFKVMFDKKFGLLYVNFGVVGNYGFYKVKIIIRFFVDQGRIEDFEVIELGQ